MSNKNVNKLISNKEEAPIGSVKLFECEKKTSLLALCVYFQSLKLLTLHTIKVRRPHREMVKTIYTCRP